MPQPEKETRELSDLERWQIKEIEQGLEEANRGEFASDEEVEETLKRLTQWRPTGNCSSRTHGKG
jgi:predicted transcriptional regulator